MKILTTSLSAPETSAIERAADALQRGGIVVFPSDTCYGLAADPAQPNAMVKLMRIKKRPSEKAVSCIFPSLEAINTWANIENWQSEILKKNLPGAFTFLLAPSSVYPLTEKGSLVGARIPESIFTQTLAKTFGKPYTATSANISGQPSAYSVDDLLAQFTGTKDSDRLPDLIIDAGVLPIVPPSTVVDLTVEPPKVVREGSALFQDK